MSTVVTLLTEADCKRCDRARAVLDRVAADFDLELRVVDLATEEGATLASTVALAVEPGVLLDGVKFSQGRLSERRLRRELAHRAAVAAMPPPSIGGGPDPEVPEAELTRVERQAERERLRTVRKERRRQAMTRKKENKNNKKDAKKEQKGKRR